MSSAKCRPFCLGLNVLNGPGYDNALFVPQFLLRHAALLPIRA